MKYLKLLILVVLLCLVAAVYGEHKTASEVLELVLGGLIGLYIVGMESMLHVFKEANRQLRNDVQEQLSRKLPEVWCSTCGKTINSVDCEKCSDWWKKQKENIA